MPELTTSPPPAAAAVVPTYNPLALLEKAIERGMDPDRLGQLMDLARQWEKDQAAQRFANALTMFSAECPPIEKKRSAQMMGKEGRQGPEYTYANYEDIDRAIRPLLNRLGIVITFTTDDLEKPGVALTNIPIVCRVRVGTHVEETRLNVPIPPGVNATQGYGSGSSYAKRYAIIAALNLPIRDDDDDARSLYRRITFEQMGQLQDLIKESGADLAAFLKWGEVTELKDLRHDRFAEATSVLRNKILRAKQAAEEARKAAAPRASSPPPQRKP